MIISFNPILKIKEKSNCFELKLLIYKSIITKRVFLIWLKAFGTMVGPILPITKDVIYNYSSLSFLSLHLVSESLPTEIFKHTIK